MIRGRRGPLVALAAGALAATAPAAAHGDCDDPTLAAAAAELALEGAPALTAVAVRRAVAAAGGSDVRVRAAVLDPDDAAGRDAFLARARDRADAPLVCGEAVTDARRVVLATGRGGRLERARGGFLVALAPGFDRPELVVQSSAGGVRRVPVEEGLVHVDADALADLAVAQLLARGPDGVRPVARLGAPSAPAVALPAGAEPAEVVASLRAAANAGPLRPNRLLSRVAGDHAAVVCRAGRAAHAPDGGDDPATRLRRAGLAARHVGEAVALGPDLAAALTALAESPAHQAAVVDPRMTDVGLGTARGPGRRCVVVLLAAWPRPTAR